MIPSYLTDEMKQGMMRLDKIRSGAEVTGIVLPEPLKTLVNNSEQALADNLAKYRLAGVEQDLQRITAKEKQKATMLFLQRVLKKVGSDLPKDEKHAVRKQYGVVKVEMLGQERMLQELVNVIAVSEAQTDPTLKLPADMLTEAQTLEQEYQTCLDSKRHYKAERNSLRQLRVEVINEYRQVRDNVYGFLMEVMPDGNRDPRLTDFGFRPSLSRRKPETPEEVTIVSETAVAETTTEVAETPVEETVNNA